MFLRFLYLLAQALVATKTDRGRRRLKQRLVQRDLGPSLFNWGFRWNGADPKERRLGRYGFRYFHFLDSGLRPP